MLTVQEEVNLCPIFSATILNTQNSIFSIEYAEQYFATRWVSHSRKRVNCKTL